MLREFNEGRSKDYYCIAATVMEIGELEGALTKAKKNSDGSDVKRDQKFFIHSWMTLPGKGTII